MKNKLTIGIFIAIVFLAIGFAAKNTVINLVGNVSFAQNAEDFKVYFYSVEQDGEEVSDVINVDKDTLTLTPSNFTNIGDKTKYTYKVFNESKQYDANVEVVCTPTSTESVSLENVMVNKTIVAGTGELGTITLEYVNTSSSLSDAIFTCTLKIEAIERTSEGEEYVDCKSGMTWDFDYIGSSEEFIAPCDGIYKLEVYGAQGGKASLSGGTALGGKGGYSSGNINLMRNNLLFVTVGSKGQDSSSASGNFSGGFNGGGTGYSSSTNSAGAGGGGATHIATGSTNRGELKNYADYKSEVLIVAGGGGGAVIRYYTNGSLSSACAGGTGGGTTGGGSMLTIGGTYATGGTLTTGYSFGLGANGKSSEVCHGGGGGGYYGGNNTHSSAAFQELSGGGGSGYITGLSDGLSENGVQEGNGHARITYLGKNTCEYTEGDIVATFAYSGSSEEFTIPCTGTYKLEVYGAQGGNVSVSGSTATGAQGGYAVGNYKAEKNETLFIEVGGKGTGSAAEWGGSYSAGNGGYNGGAQGSASYTNNYNMVAIGGGGGATHIAKGANNLGVLSNYADSQSQILIVGGGGGGVGLQKYTTTFTSLGATAGGAGTINSTFGLGSVAGGGGGYYGGIARNGGSNYIGGVTDGTTSNGVREGNGYAQITLVSLD